MALFHQKQANPIQRRCLRSLETAITTADEQDIYTDLLHLLELDEIGDERAIEAITLGEKMHVDLTKRLQSLTPDLFLNKCQFYNASTRERIVEGARLLQREQNYPAAIFCSMMLANASQVYAHLIPRLNHASLTETYASLTKLFTFNVKRGIEKAKAIVKQVHDLY
jgi:hypothetical protein